MEIVKQEVTVSSGAEKMPCYVARPAAGGPYPGLVVVMEAFGLNGNIRSLADRFAAEGFVVISPNLYFREPDNVVGYDNLPGAIKLMGSLTDDRLAADMTAAINFLKGQKDVKPKFGTTGFCMGGRVAFLTAVRNGDVYASAPFYGGGMTRAGQPGGSGAGSVYPMIDVSGVLSSCDRMPTKASRIASRSRVAVTSWRSTIRSVPGAFSSPTR